MWGSAHFFFTAASLKKPNATGAAAKNSGFQQLFFAGRYHLLFVVSP